MSTTNEDFDLGDSPNQRYELIRRMEMSHKRVAGHI